MGNRSKGSSPTISCECLTKKDKDGKQQTYYVGTRTKGAFGKPKYKRGKKNAIE